MRQPPIPSRSLIVATVAVLALALSGGIVSPAPTMTEHSMLTESTAVLIVADESGEPILTVPVNNGTSVTLAYNHSVEKTPVRDVYEVNGSVLTMVRMEFDSYGAGLPSELPVERTERGTLVAYPNGTFETLLVSPGPIARHRLEIGEESYDLVSLADGRSVRLSVEKCGGEPGICDDESTVCDDDLAVPDSESADQYDSYGAGSPATSPVVIHHASGGGAG